MNPTLYTQLAPLGFAEWLEKNEWRQSIVALEDADNNFNIDSSIRTILNALAFRWLREEKKLDFYITPTIIMYKRRYTFRHLNFQGSLLSPSPKESNYDTHELAEHHALCKALEIIKGGENE